MRRRRWRYHSAIGIRKSAMSEAARVGSIDALKMFKKALWKFQEQANVALGEAESDMQRTLNWLENEARSHWASELRKRQEAVSRAKEALRMKQVFTGPAGSKQSVVDEMKALQIAQRRLEVAERKVVAVKKYTLQLQKDIMMYKGQVQRFATSVASDLPQAAHDLEQIIAQLEAYAAGGFASGITEATSTADTNMRRAVDEPPGSSTPTNDPEANASHEPRANGS
jgi:hypothetical protein